MLKKRNIAWKKLINYYKPHKKLFFYNMFFAFLYSIITLFIPMLMKIAMDKVICLSSNDFSKHLFIFGLVIFLLFILKSYCTFFNTCYGHILGEKIEHDMREEAFKKYLELPISFYDNQKPGALLTHLMKDLNDLADDLHHIPEDVFISVLTILGTFFVLLKINFLLSLSILVIMILLFLYVRISLPKMKKLLLSCHEKSSNINLKIEDILYNGIRIVKGFANEHSEFESFSVANNNFLKSRKEVYKEIGIFYSTSSGLLYFLFPVVMIFGFFYINVGVLSISDLFIFAMYINFLIAPIQKFLSIYENFENTLIKYQNHLKILSENSESYFHNFKQIKISGKIDFDNVTFGYVKSSEKILKNLNLHIKKGEHVALIGDSGIGKSTICKLITRFYIPNSGIIKIDDVNIDQYNLQNLRNQIGFVQQDIFLFNGSIKENIAYGKKDFVTHEEIVLAAKNANIHDFIMSLPQNYDTKVGQSGVKLSGGQRQRISIARIFLKNPSILIFDEALSALDAENEKFIQESISKLFKNRTTITIAHKLSTIKKADRILILSENGIVEDRYHRISMKENQIYS